MIRGVEMREHVSRLSFEEEGHLYSVGGVGILPSITQILKAEGIQVYNGTDSFAMTRGTWIHRTIAWSEEGVLDESSIGDGIKPYLESFLSWKKATGFQSFLVEEPLWHPLYLYAGTPDLIGKIGGNPVVVELKTGSRRPGDIVQVGGQVELVRVCIAGGNTMWFDGAVLYLRDNGNPPAVDTIKGHEMMAATSMFKNALSVNRWKKNNL